MGNPVDRAIAANIDETCPTVTIPKLPQHRPAATHPGRGPSGGGGTNRSYGVGPRRVGEPESFLAGRGERAGHLQTVDVVGM